MPIINITVAEKIATNTSPDVVIVCGNSDYAIMFDFDAEWPDTAAKTARFVYTQGGALKYQDVIFFDNVVNVPVLSNVKEVYVGVYAGDLRTSTPAKVLCDRSILCGEPAHEDPPQDVYNQIMALLNPDRIKAYIDEAILGGEW